MAGGLLTSCSVLERYQYACGIVGKNPEGTWAACYKAALTHQSVRGGAEELELELHGAPERRGGPRAIQSNARFTTRSAGLTLLSVIRSVILLERVLMREKICIYWSK